jgi:hypothetical protein
VICIKGSLLFNPKIALEGGDKEFIRMQRMRSNGQASKSGKQEWRKIGRRVGIEYRRNHETHEKHEMKEVIGLQFLFSHPLGIS